MRTLLSLTAATFFLASPGTASDYEPAMQMYLDANIAPWVQSDVIVSAIKAQNETNGALMEPEILAMDTDWREEVVATTQPTITAVLENAVADFLREQVALSGGVMTEVFIMDSVGLNVAASAVTSDMWQGDEAKFIETYGIGASAVHFGDVEFDESTQSFQGQISMTISDPATGDPIGAVTVGVNADALL